MKVILRLLLAKPLKGWPSCLPRNRRQQLFVPIHRIYLTQFPMVIEDADGQFWRIQCKTGWTDEEQTVITFATASSYNHTAKQKGWRSYKGQIEYFAIYVEQLGKVYLVPVDAVGTAKAMLRLVPTKNKQEKNVRWAHDYEL